MVSIKPVNGKILIAPTEKEETTRSGLIIQEKREAAPSSGVVLESDSEIVNKGDNVLFPRFAGEEFDLEGKKVILINEEDIFAIYE